MKFFQLSKLAFAPVALLLLFPQTKAEAGGMGFSKDALSDAKSTSSELGLGKFEANPWHISVTVRGGYDDNVNLSSFDERGSFFTNAALGLTYNFGNPRTRISLSAGVSGTYYWGGDDNDDDDFGDFSEDDDDFAVNAYLGFNITHKASPRLTLTAAMQAAYLTRPGFDTFNNNFFAVERRNQNFFQTTNRFGVGYAWAPRFSTLTHYTLGYVDYNDELISFFEDRFEHTIGNEFRFLLLPTTTLVGEYRFGIVDYIDDDGRDSYSHFFLAGVDHSFSPRFNVSARGGIEVRSFDFDDDGIFDDDNDDDTHVAPYFEGTLNYALGQNTSITWFNRYSFEQPNVPDALLRETYRTSLGVRHNFTPRISAGLNFAYQHDSYDESDVLTGFDEDAIDIALTARYAMNRNFSFEVGYQHTAVISDTALFREFDRNQYWAGVTFFW